MQEVRLLRVFNLELLVLLILLLEAIEKEIALHLIGLGLVLLLRQIFLLFYLVVDLHGDSFAVYGSYFPLFELVVGNTFLLSFVLILIC